MRKVDLDYVKVIMISIALFAPFGVYFWSIHNDVITVSIHAIFWGIIPEGASGAGFTLLDPYVVARIVFYGIFNIWFCMEVIKFNDDHTRRRAALISGALSLVYPFFWAILALPFFLQLATFVYMGPIPIQQAIGFALMKLSGAHEPESPWSESS